VGTPDLLLVAAGSLAIAAGILQIILRVGGAGLTAPERESARDREAGTRLLKNRYLISILALVVFWWIAFIFTDNIFYDRAAARYPSAHQLAGFLGFMAAFALTGRCEDPYGSFSGWRPWPSWSTSRSA
jgi:hypothetical protein